MKQYIAIDLKSFYASVECVERGLDALDTCLVVADQRRTEKTICLAVSPALKRYGIGGRPRLFEVVQKVREVNRRRGRAETSYSQKVLDANPALAIDYIVAPPRMAHYIAYSARIYDIYLRFVAPEDIHAYSIDEVFMDVTAYLSTYRMTAQQLATKIIRTVLSETGITATAGIGTNMYLCKVAMDIVAKKMPPDEHGVRMATLDEMSYRQQLWTHRPLTDFWRVGRGIAQRLHVHGLYTMGDVARCSLTNEALLYRLFGVNAELLIDHAWGWEPVTMAQVKAYRPENHSFSRGQVLPTAYTVRQARWVVEEMVDNLALHLVEKGMMTDHIGLTIGYDRASLSGATAEGYRGKVVTDRYGRRTPAPANGSVSVGQYTSSGRLLTQKALELYDRIVTEGLLVRRLNFSVNHLRKDGEVEVVQRPMQLDLFADNEANARAQQATAEALAKERRQQEAVLRIKQRFGKNAILKGINYGEGATQRQRNEQIGGHHE